MHHTVGFLKLIVLVEFSRWDAFRAHGRFATRIFTHVITLSKLSLKDGSLFILALSAIPEN